MTLRFNPSHVARGVAPTFGLGQQSSTFSSELGVDLYYMFLFRLREPCYIDVFDSYFVVYGSCKSSAALSVLLMHCHLI